MSHPFDTEITHIEYGAHVDLPAYEPTPQEMGEINDRIDAMEGHTLASHPDVDPAMTPDTGDALVMGPNGWTAAAVASGVIAEVRDDAGNSVANADRVFGRDGLRVVVDENNPTTGYLTPNYGTTANTIAEGDHLHPVPVVTRHSLSNPGGVPTITSGSRDLVSATVGTFALDVPTLVEVTGYLHAEGVDDPCLFDLEITIDGATASTADIPATQKPTFEWGVNGQWTFTHRHTITRTGSQSGGRNVTFRVVWRNWGGMKVHQAWMDVRRTAYR